MRIGFNIAGVICHRGENADLNADIVQRMHGHVANGDTLFIVSFCGRNRVESSMQFLTRVGIVPNLVQPQHVYFIGNDKHAKVGLMNHLKLDVFIEDQPKVAKKLRQGQFNVSEKRWRVWRKAPGTTGDLGADSWQRWDTVLGDWGELLDQPFLGEVELYEKQPPPNF